MSRVRHNVLGAVAAALVLAATSCGGGEVEGGGGAPSTSADATTPSSAVAQSTATTAPSEEAAVLAAYQGYWDTVSAAGEEADPGHAALEDYASDAALAGVTESLDRLRELGRVTELPIASRTQHQATILNIDGDRAVLTDCSIDDGMLVDRTSGRVLNDAIATWSYRVSLARAGGRWRVSYVEVVDKKDGATSCDG